MDYALETTAKKELKGDGGIVGLTRWGSALERVFLLCPITAQYSHTYQSEMSQHKTQSKGSSDTHCTDSPAQRRHWDDSVKKMSSMFDSSYTNPFNFEQPCEQLINFATGMLATLEVAKCLIGCIDKGEESVKQFIQENLSPKKIQVSPQKASMLLWKGMVSKLWPSWQNMFI